MYAYKAIPCFATNDVLLGGMEEGTCKAIAQLSENEALLGGLHQGACEAIARLPQPRSQWEMEE